MKSPLELEKHRLERYETFAEEYAIPKEKFETFVGLYEIDDLQSFLPPKPTGKQRQVLNELIGVKGVQGYMDYEKSQHTFELIMQWQEQMASFDHAIFFTKKDSDS
jgi:hypothetical protein